MEMTRHDQTNVMRAAEAAFRARMTEIGVVGLLEVEWKSDHATQPHMHEFHAYGLVTSGSFTLTTPSGAQRIDAGDTFELSPGIEHTETVNGILTTVLAARLYPSQDA
jgi:quercetin dioxygenase-like cupin family protein